MVSSNVAWLTLLITGFTITIVERRVLTATATSDRAIRAADHGPLLTA
jgi:hypothetical protein